MKYISKSIRLSLFLSSLLLIATAFELFIANAIPIIGGFLILFVSIGFFANLIKNIRYFKKTKDAFYGLIINLIFIIASICINSIDFERNLSFSVNREALQQVIQLVSNDELKREGTIELPLQYKKLSQEGKIVVKRKGKALFVRFVFYHLFPGQFEGVIYSSNTIIPEQSMFFSKSARLEYTEKAKRWFWYKHN